MDLRKLEYFEAVSRLKSFTKAAQELHVAQPSITVSISKLEEELGVVLLRRSHRSVSLTDEGKLFLERAKRILQDVQNLAEEMRDLGDQARWVLRLAIPTSLGSWMFPVIFSQYAACYPEVSLQIYERGVQNIIDGILAETFELGFIVLADHLPLFQALPFSDGNLLVLLPADHVLSRQTSVAFGQLRQERFILCLGGSYIRGKIMAECQKYHFKPHVLFTPLQVATAFNMVASGAGISFVLDGDIAIIKDNPRIVTRPLQDKIAFQTGFIWAKDRYLSAVARQFIAFMQQHKTSR